jgi:hypothetical protein
MSSTGKKFYLKFISRKTTISLIAVLALLYFLGLVIPQKMIVPPAEFSLWQMERPTLVRWLDALQLTKIYSSPLVIIMTVLFFLNLLLVTYERIPAIIRQIRLPRSLAFDADYVRRLPSAEITLHDRKEMDHICEKLKKHRYKVIYGPDSFRGIKNSFSLLGSLFFHASFIFFLVGGLLVFHTRFRGETFVTEGQLFEGNKTFYKSISRLSDMRKSLPDIQFTVEKIEPRFEKMEPVSFKTHISAESNGVRKRGTVEVNYPFTFNTTSILVTDIGVAPLMIVRDAAGREVFGAYVALNIMRGREDFFYIPETDYKVEVRFWPDYAEDAEGNAYTRSFDLNAPVFAMNIRKVVSSIATGTVRNPADSIEFDGKRLSVEDIRYYGNFIIIDERGGGVLITGFILSIIGLMLKLVWTKKEVYGIYQREGEKMHLLIGYKTEYLRGLNRAELEKLLGKLR